MSVRTERGFTLFELMVTVTIAAVLAAFAIPAFKDVLSRNRINALSNELADALAAERNKAITSRRPVVMRPTDTGWTAYLDSYGSAYPLEKHDVSSPMVISFPGSTATEITFDANGLVRQTQPGTPAVLNSWKVQICDSNSSNEIGRDISLNRIGRVTAKRHTDSTTCNP